MDQVHVARGLFGRAPDVGRGRDDAQGLGERERDGEALPREANSRGGEDPFPFRRRASPVCEPCRVRTLGETSPEFS